MGCLWLAALQGAAAPHPALSANFLAFITVFQYMEKMPDRQAAEGLRMRIDWKFVMARYTEKERQDYQKHIGEDGQWLIAHLERKGVPAEISNLPEVQMLKTVWTQQFREAQGQVVLSKKSEW